MSSHMTLPAEANRGCYSSCTLDPIFPAKFADPVQKVKRRNFGDTLRDLTCIWKVQFDITYRGTVSLLQIEKTIFHIFENLSGRS